MVMLTVFRTPIPATCDSVTVIGAKTVPVILSVPRPRNVTVSVSLVVMLLVPPTPTTINGMTTFPYI